MRIGIDLDNTVCNTHEEVNKYREKYAKDNNIDISEIKSNNDYHEDFFSKYMIEILSNATIKDNLSEVIKRLKDKGNEIYIITARSNNYISKRIDTLKPTKKWLKKNNIKYDKLIVNVNHEGKALACLKNKVDIMVDDDIINYEEITKVGVKCILFDDLNRYDLNKVTNWLDLEKEIERND